jgi:hypothetical protein
MGNMVREESKRYSNIKLFNLEQHDSGGYHHEEDEDEADLYGINEMRRRLSNDNIISARLAVPIETPHMSGQGRV